MFQFSIANSVVMFDRAWLSRWLHTTVALRCMSARCVISAAATAASLEIEHPLSVVLVPVLLT